MKQIFIQLFVLKCWNETKILLLFFSFELKEYGEKTVKTVLEESKKLRDKLQAEGTKITPQLEAALKNVYDSAVKTANDLKVQAENAINTAKKSLF